MTLETFSASRIEATETVSDAQNTTDWGLRDPKTVEDLGIPSALVTDLLLRRCLLEGKTNVRGLSKALALNAARGDQTIRELR